MALPVQDFRLGYFLNNKAEIEPRFNINSLHANGGGTNEIGVLIGFSFFTR